MIVRKSASPNLCGHRIAFFIIYIFTQIYKSLLNVFFHVRKSTSCLHLFCFRLQVCLVCLPPFLPLFLFPLPSPFLLPSFPPFLLFLPSWLPPLSSPQLALVLVLVVQALGYVGSDPFLLQLHWPSDLPNICLSFG